MCQGNISWYYIQEGNIYETIACDQNKNPGSAADT